jgi:hypothetical protein
MQLIIGIILGIMIATIGVQGVANIAQTGVAKIQEVAKEAAK